MTQSGIWQSPGFDQLVEASSVAVERFGCCIVTAPRSNDVHQAVVRALRAATGNHLVVGCALDLPPLATGVVSLLAGHEADGMDPGVLFNRTRRIAAATGWFAWILSLIHI